MPVDCTGLLTADINYDCLNAPVGGIEKNVVLINREDIDWTNTTVDADNEVLLTNLQLKPGKTGYKFEGVKQSNAKGWELVKKENAPDKVIHRFMGVIFNPTAANKQQAQNLIKGAKYVAVVEQVWKGLDNESAFEVLGLNSGLEASTMTNNSRENDNMIMLELASQDAYEEPTLPKTLFSTDYDTTKALFDNLFEEEPIP